MDLQPGKPPMLRAEATGPPGWAAGQRDMLPGDLLLVDNIRTAHSREPFEGPRQVLVAMADVVRLADCSPTVER